MKSTRVLLLALALAPVSLVACNDPGETGDDIDCDAEPAKTFAEITAWSKCTSCHASTLTDATARGAAPLGVDFDTHDAAKKNAVKAKQRVEDGSMPPAGQPELTADEEDQIVRWVACGTPQ